MDRGTWWAAVHGVTKSQAQLSNYTAAIIIFSIRIGSLFLSIVLSNIDCTQRVSLWSLVLFLFFLAIDR